MFLLASRVFAVLLVGVVVGHEHDEQHQQDAVDRVVLRDVSFSNAGSTELIRESLKYS
jgi:hypothetical protein